MSRRFEHQIDVLLILSSHSWVFVVIVFLLFAPQHFENEQLLLALLYFKTPKLPLGLFLLVDTHKPMTLQKTFSKKSSREDFNFRFIKWVCVFFLKTLILVYVL